MIAPGRRIGFLAGVDADGGESGVFRQFHELSDGTLVCYHALCNLPNAVTTPPRPAASVLPHAAGPAVHSLVRPARSCSSSCGSSRRCRTLRRSSARSSHFALDRRRPSGWRCCAIAQNRRRFLWRVRQKLILSYVFLGFVPVLLVVALALVGGLVLYMNVAGYMFHEGFDDVSATVSAGRRRRRRPRSGATPTAALEAMTRKYANLAARYPALSLAVHSVPGPAPAPRLARARSRPDPGGTCVARRPTCPRGCAGSAARIPRRHRCAGPASPADWMLVMRAVVPTTRSQPCRHRRPAGRPAIVARQSKPAAKTRMGGVTVPAKCGGRRPPRRIRRPAHGLASTLFRQIGRPSRLHQLGHRRRRVTVTVGLDAPVARLYTADGRRCERRPPATTRFVLVLGRAGRVVPDHPGLGARHGRAPGAVDHLRRARAVRRHRAGPAGRLHAPHPDRFAAISSAIWPARSTA